MRPAMAAMDLSQMLVQGTWAGAEAAPLLQLPHFTAERVQLCLATKYTPLPDDGDDDDGNQFGRDR